MDRTVAQRLAFLWLPLAAMGLALALCEVALRLIDPSVLRLEADERNLLYQHDAALGWFPVPNSTSTFVGARTIHTRHNALGLRDVDLDPSSAGRTILLVGDSFVWGMDVEAGERFTDILQVELPGERIVNAGVSGYGTDQEYLLLERLWNQIRPDVVVLVFCVDNDRQDNSSNFRYGYFKPYFLTTGAGGGSFRGMPVPKSPRYYFLQSWLARHSSLARLAISAYVAVASPSISVADPTESLVRLMREFVEAHGAIFLVGVQRHEPTLEAFLQAQGIPHTEFEGAATFPSHGGHWTPEGQVVVAQRLMSMLVARGIVRPQTAHAVDERTTEQ